MGRKKDNRKMQSNGATCPRTGWPILDESCPDGQHNEIISYPKVPPGEDNPWTRVEKMKQVKGYDEFEICAAIHDIEQGDITHGKQLSRQLMEDEMVIENIHPDSQKVLAICKKCGKSREIDQAPNKMETVEAKAITGNVRQQKLAQYINNQKLQKNNRKVNYKIPASQKRDRSKENLKKDFNVIYVQYPCDAN